ncbi:CapA family protein [Sphingomonas sp. MG17]|uniref:CapA family protein n=1 Tax=Sphingomonas tagetis TaxID=2949092 RepID=A0A9X2HN40_9SPHN|nr:CapA family protein [Sphingomonas tagetis]MCP3732712.1 CapA family protein [Sphingomonas tagetis]
MTLTKTRSTLTSALLLTLCSPPAWAAPQQKTEAPDGFTVAISGDMLGPYTESFPEASTDFTAVKALIGSADVAFANQEGTTLDPATFPGWLSADNGGGYPRHSLAVTRAFKSIGIDLVSRANNHAMDYGTEGLLTSDRAFDAIGLAHAGTGRSLSDARAPAYYNSGETTVALIATASTFPASFAAGDAARGVNARPGLNPLHVKPTIMVSEREAKILRGMAVRQGWQGYDLPTAKSLAFNVGETSYRVSKTPGIAYDVNAGDRAALLASVAAAREKSQLVLFSIHAHETRSGGYEDPVPADFLPPLFHSVIDAGADMVVRHGPHAVQGIEIYRGKPIFYGVGHLFTDLPKTLKIASADPEPTVITLPDTWFESVIAINEYRGGRVARIVLHPMMMDGRDGPDRGMPRPAKGGDAARILSRVAANSRLFGTNVDIRGEQGVIDVAAHAGGKSQ